MYSHHFKFKINRFKKTRAPQHEEQNPLFLPFKEGTEKLKTNRILKSYQAICSHTLSYFSTMTGFESSTFQESTIFFTILLCFTRWATAILKIPVIVMFVKGWVQRKDMAVSFKGEMQKMFSLHLTLQAKHLKES